MKFMNAQQAKANAYLFDHARRVGMLAGTSWSRHSNVLLDLAKVQNGWKAIQPLK